MSDLATPIKAEMIVATPASRKDAAPRKEKIVTTVKNAQVTAVAAARGASDRTLAIANKTQATTMAIVKNPHFQVVTISTAGGAVTLGTAGGAFGCFGGMLVGGLAGTVPALLTFGTSIPFGAVVGGALGGSAGLCGAGFAGATAGGVAGHGAYIWRAEIQDGILRIKVSANKKHQQLKLALTNGKTRAQSFAADRSKRVQALAVAGTRKASELALVSKKKGYAVATDRRVQVTAASAAGGAALGGTAGGAVGTVAGAGTGAVVGLPAALFTFGLSIPVCAVIGGGLGCAAGATTGATAGGVAGGTVGYNTHKYRKEISGGACSAWLQLQNGTNKLKIKAADSVSRVTSMVSGTGGTGAAGSE